MEEAFGRGVGGFEQWAGEGKSKGLVITELAGWLGKVDEAA